jgi:hypothetical protein
MPNKGRTKSFTDQKRRKKEYMQNKRSETCQNSTIPLGQQSSAVSSDYTNRCSPEVITCHMPREPLHSSSPDNLLQLLGNSSTEIPDDIITVALQLLAAHQQQDHQCYIGYYTPAQIHFFTRNQLEGQVIQQYH